MAVTSVKLLWKSRGGSLSLTRRRTYREQWEVLTTSTGDGEQEVASAVGIPRIGSSHNRDPLAIVVSVDANQSDDTPFIWYVDVSYDSQPDFGVVEGAVGDKQDPANIPDNPLARPMVWSVSFEKQTVTAEKWRKVDNAGVMEAVVSLIRNSANYPFDPPVQIEETIVLLRCTQNVALITVDFLQKLEGAINDAPWLGIPAWRVRVSGVSASRKYEGGTSYVELSVELAVNRNTWLTTVLDCGTMKREQRTSEDGTVTVSWEPIPGSDGTPATDPVPLDGFGRALGPDQAPVFLRGLCANYHEEDFVTLLPFIRLIA